jgi:diacylglycerol kinase (ATP)
VHLILLHNPTAGDEDHSRRDLESMLRQAGHEVVYRSLKDENWEDVLAEACDVIAVAGGDGSVRKVFTAIGESPTTATLLPTGSANNIARTLGFQTHDPARLLAGWEPANRRSYDLWEVESTWGRSRCVETVGGGLFAEMLARAASVHDEPAGEENIDFGLQLLNQVLQEIEPQRWELEIDGHRFREQLLAVEAMNVRELGPNLPLAPEGDPSDGFLDVVLLRPENRDELAAYAAARLRDGEGEMPRFEVHRGSRVLLEPAEGCRLHVDDLLPAWDAGGPRSTLIHRAETHLEVLVPVSGASAG